MLVIAIPITVALFVYSCRAAVGKNIFEKAFITIGDVLALPMKGAKMMWNSRAK